MYDTVGNSAWACHPMVNYNDERSFWILLDSNLHNMFVISDNRTPSTGFIRTHFAIDLVRRMLTRTGITFCWLSTPPIARSFRWNYATELATYRGQCRRHRTESCRPRFRPVFKTSGNQSFLSIISPRNDKSRWWLSNSLACGSVQYNLRYNESYYNELHYLEPLYNEFPI